MRILSLFFVAVFALSALAQVPDGFTYQAIARSISGTPLTDQSIGIRVNIRTDSLDGTTIYSETHATTSNSVGVFSLKIGTGIVVIGDLSTIDWSINAHYLNIEMDPAGGTNYQDMGSSQIMSVPYAQFTKTSSFDMGQEVRLDAAAQALAAHDSELGELLALINYYHPFLCGDPLVDVRDGKIYPTVEVGGVCWMAENLNYDVDASGASASDGTGPTHVDSVGRYYSWAGALNIDLMYNDSLFNPTGNVRGVCPIGWHLPQDTEWLALFDSTAYNFSSELMVGGSSGMDIELSGIRAPITGFGYSSVAVIAFPLSRDERSATDRGEPQIFNVGATIFSSSKEFMVNVRCVRD